MACVPGSCGRHCNGRHEAAQTEAWWMKDVQIRSCCTCLPGTTAPNVCPIHRPPMTTYICGTGSSTPNFYDRQIQS